MSVTTKNWLRSFVAVGFWLIIAIYFKQRWALAVAVIVAALNVYWRINEA